MAKKLSHRSSRPAPHGVQNPHGMMKADTTFDPIAGPFTPAPSAATVPEISCPITAGVGNATSAFMHVQVGVTDATGTDFDEYFARTGLGDWNLFDVHAAGGGLEDGGSHCLHRLLALGSKALDCSALGLQAAGQSREPVVRSPWPEARSLVYVIPACASPTQGRLRRSSRAPCRSRRARGRRSRSWQGGAWR